MPQTKKTNSEWAGWLGVIGFLMLIVGGIFLMDGFLNHHGSNFLIGLALVIVGYTLFKLNSD